MKLNYMKRGPMLTEQEERIIGKICDIQISSYIRTSINEVPLEVENLRSFGIKVDASHFNYRITLEIERWESLKNDPNNIFNILDHASLSMFKHLLFNYIKSDINTRKLWRKVFLNEEIQKSLN